MICQNQLCMHIFICSICLQAAWWPLCGWESRRATVSFTFHWDQDCNERWKRLCPSWSGIMVVCLRPGSNPATINRAGGRILKLFAPSVNDIETAQLLAAVRLLQIRYAGNQLIYIVCSVMQYCTVDSQHSGCWYFNRHQMGKQAIEFCLRHTADWRVARQLQYLSCVLNAFFELCSMQQW